MGLKTQMFITLLGTMVMLSGMHYGITRLRGSEDYRKAVDFATGFRQSKTYFKSRVTYSKKAAAMLPKAGDILEAMNRYSGNVRLLKRRAYGKWESFVCKGRICVFSVRGVTGGAELTITVDKETLKQCLSGAQEQEESVSDICKELEKGNFDLIKSIR